MTPEGQRGDWADAVFDATLIELPPTRAAVFVDANGVPTFHTRIVLLGQTGCGQYIPPGATIMPVPEAEQVARRCLVCFPRTGDAMR